MDAPPSPWPRRIGSVWHEVWKAAITVLIAGLAAYALSPLIQQALIAPTCDDPHGLRLVPRAELTATATSTNEPELGSEYLPSFAIDGDSATAWVEGRLDSEPDKYGEGETLTISLSQSRNVQLVCVINGYAKTQDLYLHNARVRQFMIVTDAGTADSVLPEKPLEFFAGYQAVTLVKGDTTSVALTIGTARSGQDAEQESDTSISEVEIWAAPN